MSAMSVERLHDLFDQHADRRELTWPGRCHDCSREVSVTATPRPDGIHIRGGSVYEPAPDRFVLKCEACFRQDPVLRDYQPCEVYSRVVGYLRPVHQWNEAKASEFHARKTFDAAACR